MISVVISSMTVLCVAMSVAQQDTGSDSVGLASFGGFQAAISIGPASGALAGGADTGSGGMALAV